VDRWLPPAATDTRMRDLVAIRQRLGPVLVSPDRGEVQTFDHLTAADKVPVDEVVAGVDVDDFAALVLPGGVADPDALGRDEKAVAFVKGFVASGTPVSVICRAPWMLIEADVVREHTLTSWPGLQTDLRNAGASRVDHEVATDANVITSRNPDDLRAFSAALLKALG
jgi:protease I